MELSLDNLKIDLDQSCLKINSDAFNNLNKPDEPIVNNDPPDYTQ
jgi:hypothetical protein